MPSKEDKSLSFSKIGMNKDSHSNSLKQGEYTHAKNSNIVGDTGNGMFIQNEHSNLLANKFKKGFVVVGKKEDSSDDSVYYFLTNTKTGQSEIGVIESEYTLPDLSDKTVDCNNCDKVSKLSKPLEDRVQENIQEYKTFLRDCKENGFCLNLSTKYPVKTSVIKDEKCGKVIYFTDNNNPPRYIQLDKLEQYGHTGNILCGEDNTTPTCLDCEKMRIFKKFDIPDLDIHDVVFGGILEKGTYEFLIAYCDELGNEISRYYSLTNPISIFDLNDTKIESGEVDDITRYAIRLNVSNLDMSYPNYKVAVIQKRAYDKSTSIFIEGIHQTSDNTILYTSSKDKERTSFSNIFRKAVRAEKWETVTSSNNYLFGNGVTMSKKMNLQPIVNLMSNFVMWQSSAANEDLYKKQIATSNYKGYYRDEVYPLGIRFLVDGEYSPVFHFVGREATDYDKEKLYHIDKNDNEVFYNEDVESVRTNNTTCSKGSGLDERWEFYNTASELGENSLNNIETVTVRETVDRICNENNPNFTLENTTVTLTDEQANNYDNLPSFIENNREFLIDISNDSSCDTNYGQGLCDLARFINKNNSIYNTAGCGDDIIKCDDLVSFVLQDNKTEINIIEGSVENEKVKKIEEDFPEAYSSAPEPSFCRGYKKDFSDNSFVEDKKFQEDFFWEVTNIVFVTIKIPVYKKNAISSNISCSYSESMQEFSPGGQVSNGYSIGYYGSKDKNDLKQSGTKATNVGTFSYENLDYEYPQELTKGAIWFDKDVEQNDKFILNLTRMNLADAPDAGLSSPSVRMTIYTGCSNTMNPLKSFIINWDDSKLIYVKKEGNTIYINDGTNTDTINNVNTDYLYIALDNPILTAKNKAGETTYVIPPTKSCYSLVYQPVRYKKTIVSFDKIMSEKRLTYAMTCNYKTPVLGGCDIVPNKFGKFGYTESTETYPDNTQLYDSSKIHISPSDLPEGNVYDNVSYSEMFKNILGTSVVNGKYDLSKCNYSCKPIRHFKFPDSSVSPFMYDKQTLGFSKSIIYPMGVRIDDEVVKSFLDIALKNEIITKEQREKIQGYEIVRGDRKSNESIKTKGLLYDMYKYKNSDDKDVYYANYPFNDLGPDTFNLDKNNEPIKHPYNSDKNNKWTYTSAETELDDIDIPSFVNVEGEMYGRSKIQFNEVKDHSKWVILGGSLRNLASTLATTEVITEITIQAAMAFSSTNLIAGLSNTVLPGGLIGSGIILAFKGLGGIMYKYGRYRYQWLESFKNLGTPRNFAYYSNGVGYENYFRPVKPNKTNSNKLRAISSRENLTRHREEVLDTQIKERFTVNNIQREKTPFISTGDFPIEYSNEYRNYDNGSVDFNSSSRTYERESNLCSEGLSNETIKNVSNLYVALKDFVPDQYSTIGSVNWLTTGFTSYFDNTDKKTIFGGDIFITRNYYLRRMPLFLANAVGLADLIPFDYRSGNNIGPNPMFFCDYEVSSVYRSHGIPFPDPKSEYRFDCEDRSGSYIESPNKFYLFINGITSYLTESTINCNFRNTREDPWNDFYPHVGNYMDWTQENNLSIKQPVNFLYNNIYSNDVTGTRPIILPSNYDKEEYDCRADMPNGTMYSLQDNTENGYIDPWLIYRPLDRHEFPKDYGGLIELRGIETAQVLGRFENQTVIFNAVDQLTDNGSNPDAAYLGDGGIFVRRPRTFSNTDLGYAGSQTQQMVSCEYGHFFVDAKRGQIFSLKPGGKGIEEISRTSSGESTNMANWFKRNLPFNIKKHFKNVDIDNPYNGVGITMGWDSRFKRIFVTKKDYKPKDTKYLKECDGVIYDTTPTKIDDIKIEQASKGWNFERLEGCKIVFSRDKDIPAKDCLDGMKFIARYSDTKGPCPGSHSCNRALFNVVMNGITVGQVSINNKGGSYDLKNFPPNNTDPNTNDRYDVVTLTNQQMQNVLAIDNLIDISFECACEVDVNCSSSQCHSNITWLQILDNNSQEIYSGCPSGNFLYGFNPCKNITKGEKEYKKVYMPVADLSDKNRFKDVSWTISFNLLSRKWGSYFDFKPNYYVNKNDYFQTGINITDDYGEFGVWSHLLTNKSFQVFYGKKYAWEIEMPVTNKQYNRYLESLAYSIDSLRYSNEYDFNQNNEIGFEEVYIFNNTNNSGKLKLDLQKSIRQIRKYPITKEGQQRILQTFQDDEFRFNYFYNRVKNNRNGLPILIKDDNQIDKLINSSAVSFRGKKILERLRGNVFLVNLKTSETQHKKILKYLMADSKLYR